MGAQEAELAPAQGAEASGATGGAAQVAEPRAELRPEAAAPQHAAQGAGERAHHAPLRAQAPPRRRAALLRTGCVQRPARVPIERPAGAGVVEQHGVQNKAARHLRHNRQAADAIAHHHPQAAVVEQHGVTHSGRNDALSTNVVSCFCSYAPNCTCWCAEKCHGGLSKQIW